MSKRKKKHEEHIDESWLIPYADILTLLLALFIVLFASSTMDAKKFEKMSQSLNAAFNGGTGILDEPGNLPSDINDFPSENDVDVVLPSDEQQEASNQEMMDLYQLQKQFDKYIKENNLDLSLQTQLTKQGLLITILDKALFDSGSAVIRADANKLALDISKLINTDPPRQITISGHTDNIPISNREFRSNWDLSVMRAVNFLKILLENNNLKPENLSATGYGEYHPVDSNSTRVGRQNNRRVEVLILPNYINNDSQ